MLMVHTSRSSVIARPHQAIAGHARADFGGLLIVQIWSHPLGSPASAGKLRAARVADFGFSGFWVRQLLAAHRRFGAVFQHHARQNRVAGSPIFRAFPGYARGFTLRE
jgi:hypothetical protein